MPIHKPGEKFRHNRLLKKRRSARSLVAILSLTAMVDMFTVLAIFLLQNYNTAEFVVNTPKDMVLPRAQIIKELKPSIVVTLSSSQVLVGDLPVADLAGVKAQKEYMIEPLKLQMEQTLREEKAKVDSGLLTNVRKAIKQGEPEDPLAWKKVTVQADKGIDLLTLKKVLITLTEAGVGEINFAVLQKDNSLSK